MKGLTGLFSTEMDRKALLATKLLLLGQYKMSFEPKYAFLRETYLICAGVLFSLGGASPMSWNYDDELENDIAKRSMPQVHYF